VFLNFSQVFSHGVPFYLPPRVMPSALGIHSLHMLQRTSGCNRTIPEPAPPLHARGETAPPLCHKPAELDLLDIRNRLLDVADTLLCIPGNLL
jgi:hypothetical protein